MTAGPSLSPAASRRRAARRPRRAALAMAAVVAAAAAAPPAAAQPARLRLGIYAPAVEFGSANARLAYAQAIAKAIEQSTGLPVEAQSYASLATLRKEGVDLAIVDGQCLATNLGLRLLATAVIGGGTSRMWALYASVPDLQSLRGKKLALAATGCNDAGFIDNAMLDSEVDPSFFAARIGKADLLAAIAEVAASRTAQAVFAPVGVAKGLTKLFDTSPVPNPGFVDLSGKLPAALVEKVTAAVVGYGGAGAISGWARASREPYAALAGRLGRVVKVGVLAAPEPVRFDARDLLVEPATIREPALVGLRRHFVRAPGERLE